MKQLIILFMTVLLGIAPAAAENLMNNQIAKKLAEDDSVTVLYISEGMIRNARLILNNQIGNDGNDGLNAFTVPYPKDMSFMQMYVCESDNSRELAKQFVDNIIDSTSNIELIAKSKSKGKITTVFGLPFMREQGMYSTIIYLIQDQTSTSVVICGGKIVPESLNGTIIQQ